MKTIGKILEEIRHIYPTSVGMRTCGKTAREQRETIQKVQLAIGMTEEAG